MQSAKLRLQAATNTPDHPSLYTPPSHGDLRSSPRDPSLVRGRITAQLNGSSPSLQPQAQLSARAVSPRVLPSNGEASTRTEPLVTGGLERHTSANYGHHRQTSIVHGVPHHSRNSSYATSPALAHRSPQAVTLHNGFAQESGTFEALSTDPPDYTSNASSSEIATSSVHSYATVSSYTDDRDTMDSEVNMLTQRRVDHQPSGKSRREHGRSQSKHQPEQISVGEYALHHLFNSVSALQSAAEYCKTYKR